ncbi:MAG: hypothetical protein NNA23_03865 [Nitrospira sp.]|nr:hypothetical protein [Nitrospira sp.]MCP9464447.1 hypothetical protein [Nitrospira sp.]
MKRVNGLPNAIAFIGLVGVVGGATGCVAERSVQQTSASLPAAVEQSAPEVRIQALPDTLEGCLARIPADSSPGARLLAEQNCRESEELRQGIIGTAVAKSGNRASAGMAGDSLEDCLARIPADATEGQRMLAELSCERDHSSQP